MTDTVNPDIEQTNDNLKQQPQALLKMFDKLGIQARRELERRAKESWENHFGRKLLREMEEIE